jgi:hypothetical protein
MAFKVELAALVCLVDLAAGLVLRLGSDSITVEGLQGVYLHLCLS